MGEAEREENGIDRRGKEGQGLPKAKQESFFGGRQAQQRAVGAKE